jgi:hypothetical protein
MTVAVRSPRSVAVRAERRRLPRIRPSYTVAFQVGGAEGTLTARIRGSEHEQRSRGDRIAQSCRRARPDLDR